MYRNIYYDSYKGEINLWTWNEAGDRIQTSHPFRPYIYMESQSIKDATSIFNTQLRKMDFKNQFDRQRYIKTSGIKRIFHNINCDQQFLIDHFGEQNKSPDFSQHPLKVFTLDIEVDTHKYKDDKVIKFRKKPINVI